MRYFVVSNDQGRARTWRQRLAEHGFEVAVEYDPSDIVLTLGGDGTILYAARTCTNPTILPVRAGDSEGNRARLESEELLDVLDRIESGRLSLDRRTFETLTAVEDGDPVREQFRALNEISLHHSRPVLAAEFAVRVEDCGDVFEFEPVVADGALVATPFGATGYYQSITSGVFTTGFGLAFNNVHSPGDTPTYIDLSTEAVVEFELLTVTGSSPAVLTRDEDRDPYELTAGTPVEIRRSGETVEIVGPPSGARDGAVGSGPADSDGE